MGETKLENAFTFGRRHNYQLGRFGIIVAPFNPIRNLPRITTPQEIQDGFVRQFLDKWRLLIVERYSEPIVDFELNLRRIEATDLDSFLQQLNGSILDRCYTAIGASEKAKNHLPTEQLAIRRYIANAMEIANVSSIDEAIRLLVVGFSLISGDSMGGASRNIVGNLGEDIIQEVLEDNFDGEILEENASGRPKVTQIMINGEIYFVHWNRKIAAARKNYDFIITSSRNFDERTILGVMEIKSGCDPAGADEHWSTANSKLQVLYAARNDICCAFASIIIDNTVRTGVRNSIQQGTLVCGINLNDTAEIIRGINLLV